MAEACGLFPRKGLTPRSAVEVHQLPRGIVFCRMSVIHISTAPTTFLYCLYTCLSLDGKPLLCSNGCVAAQQRFALLFGDACASYPPLLLSTGVRIHDGAIP